jgi:hypothetical protein
MVLVKMLPKTVDDTKQQHCFYGHRLIYKHQPWQLVALLDIFLFSAFLCPHSFRANLILLQLLLVANYILGGGGVENPPRGPDSYLC